jgi:glucose-6-phosphate-specific signal transduction histidine kinase
MRNLLALFVGIVLSFLLVAAAGYYSYQLSERHSEAQSGALARYIFDPAIALIVGTIVGLIGESRPSLLALLSLLPFSVVPFFFSRNIAGHRLLLALLGCVYLLVAMIASKFAHGKRAAQKRLTTES